MSQVGQGEISALVFRMAKGKW